MPFYKKLEGQPSNSLHIQTLEDVPSAPPTNIRAEMINKTSNICLISCFIFILDTVTIIIITIKYYEFIIRTKIPLQFY